MNRGSLPRLNCGVFLFSFLSTPVMITATVCGVSAAGGKFPARSVSTAPGVAFALVCRRRTCGPDS